MRTALPLARAVLGNSCGLYTGDHGLDGSATDAISVPLGCEFQASAGIPTDDGKLPDGEPNLAAVEDARLARDAVAQRHRTPRPGGRFL
jgi:hypothetical protein